MIPLRQGGEAEQLNAGSRYSHLSSQGRIIAVVVTEDSRSQTSLWEKNI